MLRYTHWIGLLAAISLAVSCYMPWAWYPDIQMEFTGFYSYQNHYGKPGKMLVFLSGLSVLFFLVIGLWIKYAGSALKVVIVVAQIVIALVAFTYALKSFITFSRCYSAAICPQRLPGIYLMLISASILLLMSLLPRVSVESKSTKE